MRDLIETVESFSYSLLLENAQRAQWLLQQRGAKLEAVYKAEEASIPEITKQQIEQQSGETLPEKLVAFVMAADPTPNKGYSNWISLRLIKNGQKFEDVNQMLSTQLGIFQRAAAAKRINGNLDAIHTFSDLFAAVEPFVTGEREVSGKMDRKNKRQTGGGTEPDDRIWGINDPMRAHCKVVYDGDDYMILIPTDEKGAKYFGKNTNWCTTSGMFETYSRRGPLYIILRRKDGRKWQFHFETQQFMDERDRPIDLDEFIDQNKKVFEEIGPEKFFKVCVESARRGYRDSTLSMRHFSKEQLDSIPDDVAGLAVMSQKDMKMFDKKRTLSPEFAKAALSDPVNKDVVRYYLNAYPNDEKFWAKVCQGNPSILSEYLPESLHTDFVKSAIARKLRSAGEFESFLPAPNSEAVKEAYWDANKGSMLRSVQSPGTIPKRHMTSDNLVTLITNYPTYVGRFLDRLDQEELDQIASRLYDVGELCRFIEDIPQEMRSKTMAKRLLAMASGLTSKKDAGDRDKLLRTLATFDHVYWPKNAPKVLARMRALNPDFMKNPLDAHTPEEAARWVAYDPSRLRELPAKLVDETVVQAAFSGAEDKPTDMHGWSYCFSQLRLCDPRIIKPEWVAKEINKCPYLDKVYQDIPENYLTDTMRETLAKKGALPFDSKVYPKDGYTPENVAARFKQTVAFSKIEQKPYKANGYTYNKEIVVPNTGEMLNCWEKLPPSAKTKANLLAIVTAQSTKVRAINNGGSYYNTSHDSSQSGAKFGSLLTVVDKSLLDSDVLTKWLESLNGYSSYKEFKDIFAAFPESAHTPENMKLAVEKHVIDKVPDHLVSDDSLIHQIHDGWGKNVDWSKVTPDLFLKAVAGEPSDAAKALEYYAPKKSPLLRDPKIALALLRREKGTSGKWTYKEGADIDTLKALYGERADSRANWTQDCYDLAAGNIVKFKDVPEKFRSDAAIVHAIQTDTDNVLDIPNVGEFLRKQPDIKLSSRMEHHLLAQGFAKFDGTWLDPSTISKKTVEGAKGSYAALKMKKGAAILIFDDKGGCIDALCTDERSERELRNWSNHPTFFASAKDRSYNERKSTIELLGPYRKIIAAAFEAHPEIVKKFPKYNHGSGGSIDDLQKIGLYAEDDKIVPVEKMERTAVGGLSYVNPERSYRSGIYYLFDGNGPSIGKLSLSESGRGKAFVSGAFSQDRMPQLIERSKDIARFLALQDVTSGNNPTFKESFLYNKLGIRGPGKGEWFSLLDHKVLENGENSVWKLGPRYTVANDKVGVIASAKMTKTGFTMEVEPPEEQSEAVNNLFQKVRKTYDKK